MMRPISSAYDRDTVTTDAYSVEHVPGRGWAVYGPDSSGVKVAAEPGVYYNSEHDAAEAAEIFAANA